MRDLVFLHRDSSKVSPKPPGLASPVLALGTLGLLALGARDVCLAPWSELALASAFAATLAPLPADPELDLLSSSLDLVRVEALPAFCRHHRPSTWCGSRPRACRRRPSTCGWSGCGRGWRSPWMAPQAQEQREEER